MSDKDLETRKWLLTINNPIDKGFTTEDGITWEYYRGDRNLLSPRKSERQKARA